MSEKLSYFNIGKIVRTQGLKGEFRVYPTSSNLERYFELKFFFIEGDMEKKYYIERVRQVSPSIFVFKVEGIDVIEDIEPFINKNIYVPRSEAFELEEGEFYVADMIGLEVYTLDENYVGKLTDVLKYSDNDVYVVKNDDGREFMIPAVKKFVPNIDIESNKMYIDPIKGMID